MPAGFQLFENTRIGNSIDIDSFVSQIDTKIAQLEAEEKAEQEKTKKEKKYHVIISDDEGDMEKIAQVIATSTGDSIKRALNKLKHLPVDITFNSRNEAARFVREVSKAGGKAIIKAS